MDSDEVIFCHNRWNGDGGSPPNNPKDLDPSCKMDLDLWDCFLHPSCKMELDLWDCFGRENLILQLNYTRLICIFSVILAGKNSHLITE